jgi:hypothetical protein
LDRKVHRDQHDFGAQATFDEKAIERKPRMHGTWRVPIKSEAFAEKMK